MPRSDALILSIASALLFLLYLDHLYHSFRLYLRERKLRSFRNFFIAVMLQVGLLRIFIGILSRAFPDRESIVLLQNVTAPLLTFLLLTGGFVLAWTWRRDAP